MIKHFTTLCTFIKQQNHIIVILLRIFPEGVETSSTNLEVIDFIIKWFKTKFCFFYHDIDCNQEYIYIYFLVDIFLQPHSPLEEVTVYVTKGKVVSKVKIMSLQHHSW